MVGLRNTPNIRQVINGVRGWVNGRDARLTLFDFRYTSEDSGVFDDEIDMGKRVSGALVGLRMPWNGQWFMGPFWFNHRNDDAVLGGQVGREERDFVGVRLRATSTAPTCGYLRRRFPSLRLRTRKSPWNGKSCAVIGRLYRLAFDWRLNQYIVLSAQLEHLAAGDVLNNAGYSDGSVAMTSFTFRF